MKLAQEAIPARQGRSFSICKVDAGCRSEGEGEKVRKRQAQRAKEKTNCPFMVKGQSYFGNPLMIVSLPGRDFLANQSQ